MPRSRGSEVSQPRQSPRAPLHLKSTACSEANSIHRHSSDRSPKLDDRRSPRSPLYERKSGARVADLEMKLGQAQAELKKLKEQLAAAEDARRVSQVELEETKKRFPISAPATAAPDLEDEKEKTMNMEEGKVEDEAPVLEDGGALTEEEDCVNSTTTDVFEVTLPSFEGEGSKLEEEDSEEGTETKVVIEVESSKGEVGTGERGVEKKKEKAEVPAITELRAFLAEKEIQLERLEAKNISLKKEAEDAKACSSTARENAKEMAAKLAGTEEELSQFKMTAESLREKLESKEMAKASLEAEMKRLRVQTEQWRKAAEAAATVLASEDGALLNDSNLNKNKLGESCRSMEKHVRGYAMSMGSEGGDGNGAAKWRGGGGRIRVLGDLWKKKGQMK